MTYIELLSPAKNAQYGIEAINHGADAVYIGAPAFGARVAASNSFDDIEQLIGYAHTFHAKVYVTVNTLLFDNEVEEAVRLMHRLYDMGADAAIIQDLGLLECDLPPIALHASTQTHNMDLRRIQFLQQVGFGRVILARETSIEQMAAIHQSTPVEIEAFVHGALCVSYSGQCYMSQYLNARSGNRGCCTQPCRSAYDLYTVAPGQPSPQLLQRNGHFLSLKDFNASQLIGNMIDAGITSFKIEGRLKDMAYTKNITAYYRQAIDGELDRRAAGGETIRRSSSGRSTFFFKPEPERTFNRGFTTYFLQHRQPMASIATQKSLGMKVATLRSIEGGMLVVQPVAPDIRLTAGDGLCFINEEGVLDGFLVNSVDNNRIKPNKPCQIKPGTELWRNNDIAFEKQLLGNSAERKIALTITIDETAQGLTMRLCDEDGIEAAATCTCDKQPANDPARAKETIVRQLSKLGNTPYTVGEMVCNLAPTPCFVPVSVLNDLRRRACDALTLARRQAAKPADSTLVPNEIPYFETKLDYRANILNRKAEEFYRRHGVTQMEYGLEKSLDYNGKAIMTTKYCLRYQLGCCLKKAAAGKVAANGNKQLIPNNATLLLRNNQNWFELHFDCSRCEMQVQPYIKH